MKMKRYKNKLNWFIAKSDDEKYWKCDSCWCMCMWVHFCPWPQDIASNDWELIEEKLPINDWIDKAFVWYTYDEYNIEWSKEFRQAIELHMPKITEEELHFSWKVLHAEKQYRMIPMEFVIEKLKEKWLYKE